MPSPLVVAETVVLTVALAALAWRVWRRPRASTPPHGRRLFAIAGLLVAQAVLLHGFVLFVYPALGSSQAGSIFGLAFLTQALRALLLFSAFGVWLGIAQPELNTRSRRNWFLLALLAAGWGAPGIPFAATFLQLWLASRMQWPRALNGWRRALALVLAPVVLLILVLAPTTSSGGGISTFVGPAPTVWPPRLLSGIVPANMQLELDFARPLDRAIASLLDLFRAQLIVLTLRALTLPIRLSGMSLKRRFDVNYVLVRQIPGLLGTLVLVVGAYFAFGVFRAEQARGAFERTLARAEAASAALLTDPRVSAGGPWAAARLDSARAWLGPAGADAHLLLRNWSDATRDSAGIDSLPAPHPAILAHTDDVPDAIANVALPRTDDSEFHGVLRAGSGIYVVTRVLAPGRALDVFVPVDSVYLNDIARRVVARVAMDMQAGVTVDGQGIRFSSNRDTTHVRKRIIVRSTNPDTSAKPARTFLLSRSFLPYGDWRLGWRQGTRGALTLELRITPRSLLGNFREVPGWLISNIVTVGLLLVLMTLTGMTEGLAVRSGRTIVTSVIEEVGQLREAAEKFGAGDLTHRVPVRGKDELSALAGSFNTMAANLERQRTELIEKERLEEDLEVARQIQKRFLPQSAPSVSGLDVAGLSVPSREVGGDLFYYFVQPGGRLAVALGDVSGKSVPAALLMSNVMSALRAEAQHESEVEKSLTRINRLIVEQIEPGRFVTLFYGVVDPEAGRVRYASAGHNPVLRVARDGGAEWLREGGVPLGVVADADYRSADSPLSPGDVVVIYSDGVTEAEGPDRDGAPELFGEDRLVECVRALRDEPAAAIVQGIFAAVERFAAGRAQADDITLVVARRVG